MKIAQKIKHFILDPSGKRKALLDNSKVFCMAPWIQLHAQTNGKVAPCCMSSIKNGNEIGDLNINPSLLESWNSENMKKLRLDMLSGVKNSICDNCYDYEKLGRSTERHYYNRDFQNYFSRVKDTNSDGAVNNNTVPIIDIRFSNKCNYKCRICNSDYSTLWYDEEIKLGKSVNPLSKEIKVAANEIKFWESFKALLPTVKRLHFAGGEPLFMDEHYATLEHLIAIGNRDVNLTYNTNFSTLRYKRNNVADLWKNFGQVDIWASLDGMGPQGDYQRKGQKWETIEENIRTIQQECENVVFGVNVTVSIFNIMHIPDFFKYLVEQKLVKPERVNLYPLMYPQHFCVDNLLPELKVQATELHRNFEKNYLQNNSKYENIANHYNAIITLMNANDRQAKLAFKQAIESVDTIREEDFKTTFPELKSMLE
ncbi:MAG: twitch domain-containing radical SAM protein [Chitinophagales bacterium]|nr:twitch domain-containing radical SAM protein [Chitinophagales bacterium]